MSIEKKIEEDYEKLRSLKIAQDVKSVMIEKGRLINLYDIVDCLKRIADENNLDNNLKSCLTKKIYIDAIMFFLDDYIKNTKFELGIK